jgi:uracil-DNA glycosylase family protein
VRQVTIGPTFEAWQAAARALLKDGVPPGDVVWSEVPDPGDRRLPAAREAESSAPGFGATSPAVRVPRQFVDLARQVAAHRDPARWGLLYEVLWRLARESSDRRPGPSDPAMRRLRAMAADVGREAETDLFGATPAAPGAASFVPAGATLDDLRAAARQCTGCDLHRAATQTVFGRGPTDARIVLVGEQPGDQEDLRGAPFVGPAGEVLDRALAEIGLARDRIYVTNVVKHFSFVERGKRRIHQKPRASEVMACRPWLEAELAVIGPDILVCLGATAAGALLGPDFRLMRERGRFARTRWAPRTLATIHPSAVLRGEDEAAQARLYQMLVEDLRKVAEAQ